MTTVRLSAVALEDLDRLIRSHGLPDDTCARVKAALRPLRRFPLIGRELEGRWAPMRFIIGPWPWMLVVYTLDEARDTLTVVTIQDGRMSSAAAFQG